MIISLRNQKAITKRGKKLFVTRINIQTKSKGLEEESYYIGQAISEIEYEIEKLGIDSSTDGLKKLSSLDDQIRHIDDSILSIETTARERFRGKENLSNLKSKLDTKTQKPKNLQETQNYQR